MTKFLNNADIKGYIAQTAVTSYLLKADSTGRLVAAIAGTDYQAPTTALLPSGGTAGQILAKIDGTNYNTQWIDNYTPQVKHDVKLGAALSKGTPVYVSSANGTNMIVSAASNTSEATSSKTLGLLETGGALNDTVKVITEGLLSGLNTSTATAGDPVWLGPNGTLLFGLANKPSAPVHMVSIGIVTRVQSVNGEIFVKVQNGFELDELHNVALSSSANNEGLFYDSATSLWKNKTIAAVLGYTPANGANYLPLSGGTLTGDLTLSGTNPRLYFTDTDNNPDYFISNTDGTFTVYDVTNSVGRFKIYSGGNAEFSNFVQANGKLFIQRASNGADTLLQFKNEVGADRAYIKFGGTDEELAFYAGAGATRNMIIGSDGAMGFNYPTLAVRSFMFRALSGRPLAVEVAESGGVHSVYIRPNSSGRHLITSNYLSGGVYLPLSLSGRENDGDFVLNAGNIGIGTATTDFKVNISAASSTWNGAPAIAFLDTVVTSDARNWLIGNVATSYGNFVIASSTVQGGSPTTPRLTIFRTGQLQLNTYTSATSYSGTAAGYLAFDSSGNVITVAGVAASVTSGFSVTSQGAANNTPSTPSVNIGVYAGVYAFIDLATQNTNGSWIDFSKGDGGDFAGRIRYYANPDRFGFHTNGGSEVITFDAGGNIVLSGGSSSAQSTLASGLVSLRFPNQYSSGYTDAGVKLYIFNSGSTIQGFTAGPAYDLQYHSSGSDSGRHAFYVANSEIIRFNKTSVTTSNSSTLILGIDDTMDRTVVGGASRTRLQLAPPSHTGAEWTFVTYDDSSNAYIRIGYGNGSASFQMRHDGYTTIAGNVLLHAGNYNSYSPTLTGGGASGTWGINITGTSGYTNYFNTTFGADLESIVTGGIYRQETPSSGYNYTTTLNMNSSDGRQQMTIERGGGGMKFRGTATGSGTSWNPWRDVLHSANYTSYTIPIGGGWGADLTSNGWTRQVGVSYTGGEWVILTKDAQISTLIDGTYFAGESGGFYSLNGSNQYSSRVGFNRDGNGYAGFNAIVNAPSGFVSMSNPWGTANSAFFPNGITTAGSRNWIYGATYIGNAPGNGQGVDIGSSGNVYFRSNVGTSSHGASGRFHEIQSAAGNFIPYSFESEYGNHSWGTVLRIRINQVGADRPSMQFSYAGTDNRWNVGYCYPDDQFRVTQNMAYRNDNSTSDGWGTERFRINTNGDTYAAIGGTLYANGNQVLTYAGGTLSNNYTFRSNLGGYLGSLSNPPLQVYSESNNSAFMSFHKGGYYAVNFGLDADNVMRIGGWSASSNRWQLDMSGNQTVAGNMSSSGTAYAYGYRGNANIGGTGEASWHPAGIYSGGTEWFYGAMYRNGSHTYHSWGNLYEVGTIYTNDWFRSYGNTGWYNNDYGQGLRPAAPNSYFGTVINHGTSSNGYGGYVTSNNYRTVWMQNSSGDYGFYQMDDWAWNLFFNRGNQCWGIGTDNTYSGDGFRCIKYGSAQYGWNTWSDRRAKENISTITGALDKVLNMRGVYFNYIIDEDKKNRVGFIAQELESVLPEAVRYAEEIDEYSVEYAQIVSVLAEAIKEQNIEIQSLKSQLQTLLN